MENVAGHFIPGLQLIKENKNNSLGHCATVAH